jgi:adenosylcobinamide kinase / adenosylcobinamide-phosphate guanylyltransferase
LPEKGTLTFLLGGARSGKSAHAESLVSGFPPPWTYIATAQGFDSEMAERIAMHKDRRDERWRNVDAPFALVETLDDMPESRPVLVDCLTLWLSNHMLAGHDVAREIDRLVGRLKHPRGPWFVVSNEVGLGIVPDNALARRFRDAAGQLNQQVAQFADSVVFMVAGLPLRVR